MLGQEHENDLGVRGAVSGGGGGGAAGTAADPAGPDELVARLAAALSVVEESELAIEVYRTEGIGRGRVGPWEWLEDYRIDGAPVVEVLADIRRRLRDLHGGGEFRLVIRDPNKPGGYLLNAGLKVKRQPETSRKEQRQDDGNGMLLAMIERMDARAAAAEERFLQALEKIAKPAEQVRTLDEDIERLTRLQTAFGGGKGDIFDAVEKVEKLKQVLGGGGDSDPWAKLAGEVVPDLIGLARDVLDGGGEVDEEDEEPEGDDGEDAQTKQLRKALAGFTGKIHQAARMRMAPDAVAKLALQGVKNAQALVRFCRKENATALLLQAAPELVKFAGWVEQVRGEIVRAGSVASTAALPPGSAKTGAGNADGAVSDTERRGRSAGNAATHAGDGGGGKAPAGGAGTGGGAGAEPAGKGLRRGGGKGSRVRS